MSPAPQSANSVSSIAFEVTARCHRRCLYCYNVWKSSSDLPTEELDIAEIRSIFSRLRREAGLRRVDLTGGEPLLRPDIFEVMDALGALGLKLTLVSDGKHITSEVAKELARRKIVRVQPTLLSTDRQVHNALKGGGACAVGGDACVVGSDAYDDALRAVARLLREKVPLSVSYICTRRNFGDFEEVVKLCYALGVKHMGFGRLCTSGEAAGNLEALCPEPGMVRDCLERIPSLSSKYGMEIALLIAVPHCLFDGAALHRSTPRVGYCAIAAGEPHWTLSPSGEVRPCSVSPVSLGNLTGQGWSRIAGRYRREVLPIFRERLPLVCRQCDRLERCLGGCRESARGATGELTGRDPLCPCQQSE